MKKFFLIAIFLFPLAALAQSADSAKVSKPDDSTKENLFTLKGRVSHYAFNYGRPLAGAKICIVDGDKFAISKSDGTFSLTGIPAGSYIISVSAVSRDTLYNCLDCDYDRTRSLDEYTNYYYNFYYEFTQQVIVNDDLDLGDIRLAPVKVIYRGQGSYVPRTISRIPIVNKSQIGTIHMWSAEEIQRIAK